MLARVTEGHHAKGTKGQDGFQNERAARTKSRKWGEGDNGESFAVHFDLNIREYGRMVGHKRSERKIRPKH